MRAFAIFCSVCGVLGFATTASKADTVTFGASRDATIFQNPASNASGGGPGLFAGTNGTPSPRRALIDFDIAGHIPAGSTINSVVMTLYLGQVAGSGGGGNVGTPSSTVDIFKVTQNWGEGTADTQNPPTDSLGGRGQGNTPSGNDATWNARFFSTTTPVLWTTPGGDFVSTASASEFVPGPTLLVGYTWGTTSAMVSDVQSWLDSPSTNFGWILKNEDEVTATDFRAFLSREAADHNPQITIDFTAAPEPAAIVLSALGFGALIAARMRRRL